MSAPIQWYGSSAVDTLLAPGNQDRQVGIQRMRGTCNAGLVWDRYLHLWRIGRIVTGGDRLEVLQRFADDFNARDESASVATKLLALVHSRQGRVLQSRPNGGETLELKLETRFVTGLGAPHPTETGLSFDREVGVPFLSGSSVKGVARAAAKLLEEPSAQLERLFGPERIDDESASAMGDLVFLDAFPLSWPKLKVDIINCHHSDYYAERTKSPSESENPIPVYFLTVEAGTSWAFRFFCRSGIHSARAKALLSFGLQNLGAGGKTAVGYGFFGKDAQSG